VNRLLIGIAALALAPRAYAGSCDRAASVLLAQHAQYVTYCPECGDAAPSAPATWQAPAPLPDFVHTYLQTSPARYELAATLDGCDVVGLPYRLRVVDETATGVMIVPDTVPAAPAPAAATAPVVVDDRLVPTWLAGLLGGLTGIAFVLCVPNRRRRTLVPRAIDLVARDDTHVTIDR